MRVTNAGSRAGSAAPTRAWGERGVSLPDIPRTATTALAGCCSAVPVARCARTGRGGRPASGRRRHSVKGNNGVNGRAIRHRRTAVPPPRRCRAAGSRRHKSKQVRACEEGEMGHGRWGPRGKVKYDTVVRSGQNSCTRPRLSFFLLLFLLRGEAVGGPGLSGGEQKG